jgi:plasmid stabilization system protein ParE
MKAIFHRLIKKDLRSALEYYDSEGGALLGDRFFEDVESTIAKVEDNPERFHHVAEGLRRAPLVTFPYHFLYERTEDALHFLVLRHDKRHPGFGLNRRRI